MKIMKRNRVYWRVLLRSSNHLLGWLFIVSIVWLCIYQFFLAQIPTLPGFGFMEPLGVIFLTLTTGYIIGYFFYFLTVHIPYVNRKLKVEIYIHNLLVEINNFIILYFSQLINVTSPEEITKKNFLEALNKIPIDKPVRRGGKIYGNYLFYHTITCDQIIKLIEEAFPFIDVISDDIIGKLTSIKLNLKKSKGPEDYINPYQELYVLMGELWEIPKTCQGILDSHHKWLNDFERHNIIRDIRGAGIQVPQSWSRAPSLWTKGYYEET